MSARPDDSLSPFVGGLSTGALAVMGMGVALYLSAEAPGWISDRGWAIAAGVALTCACSGLGIAVPRLFGRITRTYRRDRDQIAFAGGALLGVVGAIAYAFVGVFPKITE